MAPSTTARACSAGGRSSEGSSSQAIVPPKRPAARATAPAAVRSASESSSSLGPSPAAATRGAPSPPSSTCTSHASPSSPDTSSAEASAWRRPRSPSSRPPSRGSSAGSATGTARTSASTAPGETPETWTPIGARWYPTAFLRCCEMPRLRAGHLRVFADSAVRMSTAALRPLAPRRFRRERRRLGVETLQERVAMLALERQELRARGAAAGSLARADRAAPAARAARARGLASNYVQDFVPLALHQLAGARLEVQAQERLRVGGPHVHVPVGRVDRDAVQVRDLALAAEALLQLLELQRHVRDRRVQLAGDEVALAVGLQDLRELPALLRHELQHEQEGDDARVRLREGAEVVVPRDLAGEGRVLLPHPVLDERVADAVDERDAAGALDGLRHGPARANVVDDLRARLLLEHRLGQQRRDEVAGDELAGVVDEEAPVGVAVEGDPEIGALLQRLADDELPVLREERVRLVVRKGAVGLEEAPHRVDRQPVEDRRGHRARPFLRRRD